MQVKMIWTIGHSTRSFDEFKYILKTFEIGCLVDIRGLPGSKKFPHFNKEMLEKTLPENGIRYVHLSRLGGRRKTMKNSIHTGWRSMAFRGYADYMDTDEFLEGIRELEEIALSIPTAYMCAESLWWRCHRSMVSDFLKLRGWKVMHIMSASKSTEHTYTSPARIKDDKIIYDQP